MTVVIIANKTRLMGTSAAQCYYCFLLPPKNEYGREARQQKRKKFTLASVVRAPQTEINATCNSCNRFWSTCFTDAFPSLLMAKFVSNNLNLKKLAILSDIRNDYSVDLADVFANDFKKMDGIVVADESYGEGDTDFSAQLHCTIGMRSSDVHHRH